MVVFLSGACGICYLAGYLRIMSGLLVFFGSLAALFFGLLFSISEMSRNLQFPVDGDGGGLLFIVLAVFLCAMAMYIVFSKEGITRQEEISSSHFRYLFGGIFVYLISIFLASYFWFPSDELRLQADSVSLGRYVLLGTVLFLLGQVISLYLFHCASKGGLPGNPDLMRRLVLALFAVFHLDKIPLLFAFLLVYSPEAQAIYPWCVLLVLGGYIPTSIFLLLVSRQAGPFLLENDEKKL